MVLLPEAVQRKARAVGAEGMRWLDELDAVVSTLAAEWNLQIGPTLQGGSSSFVANVTTGDGNEAVLKLAIPDGLEGNSDFDVELSTLNLANGGCYVRVLRSDGARRAVLEERLGRSLDELRLAVPAQIDVITATVARGWRPVRGSASRLRSGADQAHSLSELIPRQWEDAGRRCAQKTVRRAVAYAQARRDAFDSATAVLVHGDAHPSNVLEDPAQPGAFKLIDPDGMRSSPEHELAIPLRGWTDELLAGDAVALGRTWAEQLATRASADPTAIWEWAFVERVSTGLFLLQLGDEAGARQLAVADLWAESVG